MTEFYVETDHISESLKHAGFTPEQAEAIVKSHKSLTNVDVQFLRKDMEIGFERQTIKMESGFAKVDGEMKSGFARVDGEMKDLRKDMESGFARVDGEMKSGFARLDGEIKGLRKDMESGFAKLELKMTIKLTGIVTAVLAIFKYGLGGL